MTTMRKSPADVLTGLFSLAVIVLLGLIVLGGVALLFWTLVSSSATWKALGSIAIVVVIGMAAQKVRRGG